MFDSAECMASWQRYASLDWIGRTTWLFRRCEWNSRFLRYARNDKITLGQPRALRYSKNAVFQKRRGKFLRFAAE